MQRLNERSASCSGDVLQTRQVARRSGVETLEGGVRLRISLAGTEDNFLWNDEFWFLTYLFWGMEMGESIRSHILGTWTIGDREIEAGEKQRPPGLSGLSLLASRKVFWDERKRITELGYNIVECLVIDTRQQVSVLLGHKEKV